MEADAGKGKTSVLTYIDIGTNSIRLLIVRLNPNYSYTVLRQDKEVVRLGEKEYENGRLLSQQAMDRAVLVCKNFLEISRSYGSKSVTAAATSATREAGNRCEFLERLRKEAGIDAKMISGREEARLVYLGIASGVHIGKEDCLFIDVGGGSTEMALGNQYSHSFLDSVELGSIRLTSMFLQNAVEEPVGRKAYEEIKLYAKNRMLRAAEVVGNHKIKKAFGSSGTIVNLAEIAARMNGTGNSKRDHALKHKDLKKVSAKLCSLSLPARKKVPGINPDRADIIICGAVILDALMEEFGIEEIKPSERGLLHGMLMDDLSRRKGFSQFHEITVRDWSVLQLGRSCALKEKHANTVAMLSLQLFDSGKKAGLHRLGPDARELLKYAAVLHDVGDFVSYADHNLHSHYLIKNTELLGFDQDEINVIASVAKYHRKKPPKKKELIKDSSNPQTREEINVLSGILRIAENLDRSHTSSITKAAFTRDGKNGIKLTLRAGKGCELERWSLEGGRASFKKTFGKELTIRVAKPRPRSARPHCQSPA